MRTKSVVGVVLCFGLAFALLSGSQVGPMVFGESPGGDPTAETLEQIGNETGVEQDRGGEGLTGDVAGDNEPTVVGLTISAARFGWNLVVAVGLLPLTLVRLGFPTWFSYPVGSIALIISFIGFAQFVIGREWL